MFAEIWPLLLVGLVVGFAAGWWCRMCLQRGVRQEHAAELAHRDQELTALRSRTADLEVAAVDLQTARARIVHLEGDTADLDQLRTRLAAAEREAADAAELRTRMDQLAPQAARVAGLEGQVSELQARSDEIDVLRTRLVSLDREASDLRTRVKQLQEDDRPRIGQARLTELEEASRQRTLLQQRLQEAERALQAAQGAPADQQRKLDQAQRDLETVNARHREQVAMLATARQENDDLRRRIAELEGASLAVAVTPAAVRSPAPAADGNGGNGAADTATVTRTVVDLDAGREVLGRRVRMDDLTLVEGIGPKISRLCREAGITTWRTLSVTPVPRLQSILDAAGPSYRMHDPATWPRQAALLADGRWDAFKDLIAQLRGGRA
ncbi:MAG: hypothetical protein U0Y82_01170 [Thermoleophilia bacterium]